MDHLHTFTAFAATYGSLDDAEAGYKAITDLSNKEYVLESFDVAVITKDDKGKVKIVKKHEQPLRKGVWVGGGLGLATGLCVALFPAVVAGAAIVAGVGMGSALGALAGHAAGGMSRSDLKDFGETLDQGHSAVVAVAVPEIADRVADCLRGAQKVERRVLKADPAVVQADVERAGDDV